MGRTEVVVELGRQGSVLHVHGDLDLAGALTLETVLAELPPGPVTFDLAAVPFLDSRGLRTLLVTHRERVVTVRRPSPAALDTIRVAGMDTVLSIEPEPVAARSPAPAQAAVGGSPGEGW